ncbi:MAG: hypothetical protein CMQ20_10250 [Gammaproteobacteria bacterium]|jgi:hypothetical protein|nr:hypothetical protein [Gammaproteobacteria bacterium]|tara:strand:+ start:217 stop:1212 length:996 start_codon:yes stop_codon:yes gene_type:complete
MTRLLQYFLLLVSSLAFAEEAQLSDYGDWYQVEIIVFKQKRQPVSDEIWPLQAASYPLSMVAISPPSNDEIAPYSLSQLDDLLDSEGLFDTDAEKPAPIFDGFLFEDRGSHIQNRLLLEAADKVEPVPSDEILELAPEIDASSEVEEAGKPVLDFVMADELLNSPLPQAYRALPEDSLSLGTIARSLRRSSGFELMLHQAWRQPLSGKPKAVLIQTGDRYDDLYEIDGTLSFSRSRFLHLDANLWFTQFEPKFNQQQFIQVQPGDLIDGAENYPELVEMEQNKGTHIAVHSHLLQHSRRMRSSVLHYIDHPFFGVLVQIDNFTYSPETAAE